MDCFCGCGRKVRRRQTDENLQAGRIALELLAWDKARFEGRLGPPAADDAERVMQRGAERYRRLIESLHGERDDYTLEEGEKWLRESADQRRDRRYMTKRGGVLTPDKLLLTEEDHERLDRLRPEQSFSAGAQEPDALERLSALHAEGILTDEEFEAAKNRALRR